MNKQSQTRSLNRVLTILIGLFAMLPCSRAIAQQPSNGFGKTAVTGIEFRIADDNLDQFGFALPIATMTTRVIDNLAGWHYPVKAASTKPTSHTLQAHIGQQTHQETPVGFSFSSGNSDPRSPEFQKADVISITCSLTANNNSQQSVTQTMDFSAGPMMDAAKKHADQAKTINLLVEHTSTVCFNLLDDLDLEVSSNPAGKPVSKPGWMPEIRIEIEEPPAKETDGPVAEKEPVKSSEGRKQITIHNQGTPVILKLGHDRL